MAKVNAGKCFAMGNASEKLVNEYFTSQGCDVTKMDHEVYPYDFNVVGKTDTTYTVEVKTWGMAWGGTTMYAETVQISAKQRIESIPEYLTHHSEIDYIVWYNRYTGWAHFFDCSEFACYIEANKNRQKFNGTETAKGILIESECIEAGYRFKEQIGGK